MKSGLDQFIYNFSSFAKIYLNLLKLTSNKFVYLDHQIVYAIPVAK